MRKPSWIQPLDLLPVLFTVACTAYALTHEFEAKHRGEAMALLLVVPVVMAILIGLGWYKRKQWLDSFVWYPTYGFMIDTEKEGYLPPAEQEFDAFIASTARAWAAVHPAADLLLKSRVKWLYFRKGMDEKPMRGSWGLVKGVTVLGGSTLYVDYNFRLEPLEHTALEHELGHVIHGLATGTWDQEEHHSFMKKHGLR